MLVLNGSWWFCHWIWGWLQEKSVCDWKKPRNFWSFLEFFPVVYDDHQVPSKGQNETSLEWCIVVSQVPFFGGSRTQIEFSPCYCQRNTQQMRFPNLSHKLQIEGLWGFGNYGEWNFHWDGLAELATLPSSMLLLRKKKKIVHSNWWLQDYFPFQMVSFQRIYPPGN